MTDEEITGTRVILDRGVDPHAVGNGGTAIVISESHGAPLFVEMRVPKEDS
jgi:hypothetical protein